MRPRVEYMDLMKGICIVMVVALHCHLVPANALGNIITTFMVPSYFFLSGLFFKEYGGFSDFAVRKIDKLVVPTVFFSVLYLIFKIVTSGYGALTAKEMISALITGNFPLWFLQCLFLINMLFFVLHRFVSDKVKLLVVCSCVGFAGIAGYAVSSDFIREASPRLFYVLHISHMFKIMASLPFFALGYAVKPYMTRTFPRTATLATFCAALVLMWVTGRYVHTSIYDNVYGRNPLFFYVAGTSGIACMVILCRAIKRIPLISYLGRYSLVVLGTHYVVLSIFSEFMSSEAMVFALTVLSMFAIIPVFIKIFPYLTAQKDLFRVYVPSAGTASHKQPE